MLSSESKKFCVAWPARGVEDFVLRGESICHAVCASESSPQKVCDARACITDIMGYAKCA